jgi:hypothetical protein
MIRPNTGDTYNLWLASKPKAGLCFMISNQPYCLYQQLVAEPIMPKVVTFETVGPASDPSKAKPCGYARYDRPVSLYPLSLIKITLIVDDNYNF